ncbi:MAG: hypothetical protein B7X86_16260 [Sphingobacteriales bacterium 17-39-43]|uniref:hypothetical protein n=1 Tax=Daejeonella sp. TaxID=2805397 RepID=UPI000BCC792F|nr:hypothetical protein [Daejeonella sp.]OYZ28893.1 MAG: hypothetical protein B7Y24_16030 [Sphingobacteriales bacterium 16-39-50]OZA22248.1 MAG: hypothetical protein B7X86_16260 [Sphingobacteriales bacterium 17-39-43]HQT22501.1 hypothetical protein [Daejeonella sp.]HQT59237.1 hypothetical protein [Daejeonella sp.]
MNKFYEQSIFLQWLEAILLLIVGFYPAIMFIELSYSQPLCGLLFFIYLPLGQFAITPLFKLSGIYKYYSPMLLGYMANQLQIDLHSGGSFDYLFVMRKFKKGIELRKALLTYHLVGLLNVISQIEEGAIPKTVTIVGTSYFFNERTINKIGFESQKPSLFYRINLFVNFIDLTWMYSVAKGHFAIPKLWKANKAQIDGGKLLEKKEMIKLLYEKLNKY